MGIICPIFRGGCHIKSLSRGHILTNPCWNEFGLGQACPSANGIFYPTSWRGLFGPSPMQKGIVSPIVPPPSYRWIALWLLTLRRVLTLETWSCAVSMRLPMSVTIRSWICNSCSAFLKKGPGCVIPPPFTGKTIGMALALWRMNPRRE